MKRFAILLPALASLGLLVSVVNAQESQGQTFKTDFEGFILNWLILEPSRVNGLEHSEAGVMPVVSGESFKDARTGLPKAGDTVTADGTELKWHAVNSPNYVINLTGFASEQGKPGVNVIFWGIAYITAPEEMKDVRLAIGSDDDSVWWLNDREVIRAFGVRQTATDDNVSRRLNLSKGVHLLRFAVIQGDGPSDCCARLLDAAQEPITNITISLTPPAAPATAPAE